MRIRRGGVDRLVRRFLAGTVLILLMLLCGRYISRAAGSITKNECRNMICAGGQWLVEAIWLPVCQALGRMSGEAEEESMTRILLTANTTR